jgi:hypothetical protein
MFVPKRYEVTVGWRVFYYGKVKGKGKVAPVL